MVTCRNFGIDGRSTPVVTDLPRSFEAAMALSTDFTAVGWILEEVN
jgi:hypothetical protein